MIVALHTENDSNWSIDLRILRGVERTQVFMHTEINYRSTASDLRTKIHADATKLMDSVKQARNRGEGLPWTSLVLLGDAWRNRTELVMKELHELTHQRAAERVELVGRPWWPFIDAIILPTIMYRKHQLFESQQLDHDSGNQPLPCWAPIPTAEDLPLRPLAMARAMLAHRIRLLQEPDQVHEGPQ